MTFEQPESLKPRPATARPLASENRRDDDETLVNSRGLMKRYGVSAMWRRRRAASDPSFPKPIFIGTHPFWRLGELRAWEAGLPHEPPLTAIAAGKRGAEVAKAQAAKKSRHKPSYPDPSPQRPSPEGRSGIDHDRRG
jgi:hypothetical protein